MNGTADENLAFLAAWIHGRRGRMAAGERLDALCRLPGQEELSRAVLPREEALDAGAYRRRVAGGWLSELEALARRLGPARARMLAAFGHRLRVEDLKLLVRGLASGLPPETVRQHFLCPPGDPALAAAGSLEAFAAQLAATPFPGVPHGPDDPALRPFLLETRLDHSYFLGLLAALEGLAPGDRLQVEALVHQEVDHFHLMLAARGRFLHRIGPEFLLPWHLAGTGLARRRFLRMLTAADLAQAAALAHGHALDPGPLPDRLDPAGLDALAWNRFQRLGLRLFSRGAMDFGTLVGYLALRRVEVANLLTLCEGIRLGVPFEALRARMVPRSFQEAACA